MSWAKNTQSTRSFFYAVAVLALTAVGLWWGAQLNTTQANVNNSTLASAPAATFAANAGTLGAIPDAPAGGVGCGEGNSGAARDVTFNVSGLSGAPTNVEVSMTLTHSWSGDVTAVLIAPNGASHTLFGRRGATTSAACGSSSDFAGTYSFRDTSTNTTFFTVATNPVPATDYRATTAGGSAAGGQVTNITTAFSGVSSPNGTWTLRLTDAGDGDTGSITAATLTVDAGPPPGGSGDQNRLDYIPSGPSANLSDWAVVRAASATAPLTWSIARNDNPTPVNGVIVQFPHGIGSDSVPAFGNYAGGAGSADDANVWRATTADQTFYFIQQIGGASSQIEWGQPNDIVGAEGDYDGDGVMDPTVVRAPGTWFILRSQTQTLSAFNFGATATDGFLPGADYTGDGADDPAVIRLGTGNIINWLVGNTSGASVLNRTWGDFDTDFVLPGGDYDGDDKADFAVWRGFANPPAGDAVFYISENDGGSQAVQWGIASATTANRDIPLRHGDYDGDGITDVAVWRRSNQTFYVRRSSNGSLLAQQWGVAATDVPVASLGTF